MNFIIIKLMSVVYLGGAASFTVNTFSENLSSVIQKNSFLLQIFKSSETKKYHRYASPTQSHAICCLQQEKSEIWGKKCKNIFQNDVPKVKAYVGPLPEGIEGIEFETGIAPDSGTPPHIATWSGSRDDVEVDGDYAKIRVTITKNSQCD